MKQLKDGEVGHSGKGTMMGWVGLGVVRGGGRQEDGGGLL